MSKFNSNFVKSKIESIAKNPQNRNRLNSNDLTISSKTLKDSFSYLEEFKDSLKNNSNLNIKKSETNYTKNNLNLNLHKNNISSLLTKNSSDNLNNLNIINETFKEKISNNKMLYDNIIKEINISELSELKEIYNDLFILFNDIKINQTGKDKDKAKNDDDIQKIKILALHFIQILLNDNIKKLLQIFFDSNEINKFFLYQIYLILSIIYFDEKKLSEYLLLSYKTILLYSLQNFEIISQILEKFSLSQEDKINKNIFILNKIIISLLKTLTNVPSNAQILYYISPERNNSIKTIENSKDNIDEKESGINKLLFLLKSNKDLNEKMNIIEMEEKKILEKIESSNQKILPEFDSEKYKFSIFIELDETLVHYCEEGENYFVKVRLGSENFLEYIKTFCEIIIVSTSSKEYSDIIIDNLNKKGDVIKHRIYAEDNTLLDLSKINRDMNKCIFISHEKKFMKEPDDNTLTLKGFYGDETDKEFIKLENEFKKIEKKEIKDIKTIIKEMQNNINKEK